MTGKVEYVENGENNTLLSLGGECNGCRIKIRMDGDGNKPTSELPWAFPLNPKVIQSVPKVGEGVIVFLENPQNLYSQRYYIGPIISQPQFFEFCNYGATGRGEAMSLMEVGSKSITTQPLTGIDRKKDLTYGSFPNINDIALIGRGQEDIVLKYRTNQYNKESEIDLRTGIRLEPSDTSIKYIRGNVVFNDIDPAFIQVKHSTNGLSGLKHGTGDDIPTKYESQDKRSGKGIVNVVADKINLISHKDNNGFGNKIADKEDLVKKDEIDEIMSMLHRAVYGDELIIILKKIVNVLATHIHPYNQLPPTIGGTELTELIGYPFEDILSPHVRIS